MIKQELTKIFQGCNFFQQQQLLHIIATKFGCDKERLFYQGKTICLGLGQAKELIKLDEGSSMDEHRAAIWTR